MNYAQKRSIYFENNFTHKTFLEYYSAYWIYSNVEKKNKTPERNLLISKYIDNSFWHIVLELLLNMIDKNQADNEMMDDLITYQIQNDRKSLPFILSTIDSYKNVSKECITASISLAIDFLFIDYNKDNFLNNDSLHSKVFESIKNGYGSGKLNSYILGELIKLEATRENIDLLYALYFEIDFIELSKENFNYIFNLKNQSLFENTIDQNKFLFISSCYNIRGNENQKKYFQTVEYFYKTFGIPQLYTEIPFYFSDNYYLPMIYYYFKNQIKPDNVCDLNKNLNYLFEQGIKTDHIIKFLSSKNLYYAHTELNETIFQIFDDEENPITNIILLLIMFNNRYNVGSITKWAKGKKKEKMISEINSLTIDNRVKEIFKIYNYKPDSADL